MTNHNVFASTGLVSKRRIVMPSRPSFDGYSEEVAQNIFRAQNELLEVQKQKEEIQEKINLIEDQKADKVLSGSELFWYNFILWAPVLGIVAFVWDDFRWYSIAFFGFIAFCFSLSWANGFAKKKFLNELAGIEEVYNQKSTEYVNLVQDNVVPQIHGLGLVSYKEIREKTYGFALEDSLLKQLLDILKINEQIEEISFNNIKENQPVTLYRSRLMKEDDSEQESAMESMVLDID